MDLCHLGIWSSHKTNSQNKIMGKKWVSNYSNKDDWSPVITFYRMVSKEADKTSQPAVLFQAHTKTYIFHDNGRSWHFSDVRCFFFLFCTWRTDPFSVSLVQRNHFPRYELQNLIPPLVTCWTAEISIRLKKGLIQTHVWKRATVWSQSAVLGCTGLSLETLESHTALNADHCWMRRAAAADQLLLTVQQQNQWCIRSTEPVWQEGSRQPCIYS